MNTSGAIFMPLSEDYPLHYLWIGPPAKGDYEGSDTIGPDLMRDRDPNFPIHFWCLEEHVNHYQKAFEGKNITIHAAEPFLKEKNLAFYEFFIRLRDVAETKQARSKDKARDNTTLKAALQYYLQCHYHGFFLDCNIIPAPNVKEIPSKDLKSFTCPALTMSRLDGWLMYSPKEDREADKRFFHYFNEAKGELDKRDMTKPYNIDRDRLGKAFVEALRVGQYDSESVVYATNADVIDCIQVLGFQKRYNNSHKKGAPLQKIPLILRIVKDSFPSSDELRYYMVKRGLSPTTPYELPDTVNHNNSILGLALKYKKTNIPLLLFLIKQISQPQDLFDEKSAYYCVLNLYRMILDTQDKTLIKAMFAKALLLHFEDEKLLLHAINRHLFAYQGSDKLFEVVRCDSMDDFIDFIVDHGNEGLYDSLEVLLQEGEKSLDLEAYLKTVLYYAYKLEGHKCLAELIEALKKDNTPGENRKLFTMLLRDILNEMNYHEVIGKSTDDLIPLRYLLRAYIALDYPSEEAFLEEIRTLYTKRLWPMRQTQNPDFSSLDTFIKCFGKEYNGHVIEQTNVLLANGPGVGKLYELYHVITDSDPQKLQTILKTISNPNKGVKMGASDLKRQPIERILRTKKKDMIQIFITHEIGRAYHGEEDFLNTFNILCSIKIDIRPFTSLNDVIDNLFGRDSIVPKDTLIMMFSLGPITTTNEKEYAKHYEIKEESPVYEAKTDFFAMKEDKAPPLLEQLHQIALTREALGAMDDTDMLDVQLKGLP